MVARYFAGDKTKTHVATWRRLSDGKIRVAANGTFVTPVVADWDSYQHVLSQAPANSGRFELTVPVGLADGSYAVEIAERTNAGEGSVDDLVILANPDVRVVDEDFAEGVTVGDIPASATGEGDIAVDHNTGGTDIRRVVRNNVGVDNCIIRAYLATDYAAGNFAEKGKTYTGSDGRWTAPLMLNAGDYKVVIYEPARATSQVFDLEVS